MPKYKDVCDQLKERFELNTPCCNSCHYDADMFFPSYPLLEYELDGRTYHICCSIMVALDELENNG